MRPAVRYDSGPFRFPALLFALHFGRCDEPIAAVKLTRLLMAKLLVFKDCPQGNQPLINAAVALSAHFI